MAHTSCSSIGFPPNRDMDMRGNLPGFIIKGQGASSHGFNILQVNFRPDGSILILNLFTRSDQLHLTHTSNKKRDIPLLDVVCGAKIPQFRKKVFSMLKGNRERSSQSQLSTFHRESSHSSLPGRPFRLSQKPGHTQYNPDTA